TPARRLLGGLMRPGSDGTAGDQATARADPRDGSPFRLTLWQEPWEGAFPTARPGHSQTRTYTHLGGRSSTPGRKPMKPLLAALVAALSFVAPAGAQPVADHLKCYKVKDTQAKATYTADLGGLVAEPGCRIRVPGTLLCVETTKTNVTPTPSGGADNSGPTGRFMCYKLKCPKATLAGLQWHDQFGDRQVTPSNPQLLCAPEILAATTTTTTTLPTPPADL